MSRIKCDAEGNYIEAYGYKLGEIVTAKYDLFDEQGGKVQAGDKLRIVAITPKVVMFSLAKRAALNAQDGFEKRDSKELFLNLVRADQEKDYGSRIREDFCCITKRGKIMIISDNEKTYKLEFTLPSGKSASLQAGKNPLTGDWMEIHSVGEKSNAYVSTKRGVEKLVNAIIDKSRKANLPCKVIVEAKQ